MSRYIHCPKCHRIIGEYSPDGLSVCVEHSGRKTCFYERGATSCSCGTTVEIRIPRGDKRGEKVLK